MSLIIHHLDSNVHRDLFAPIHDGDKVLEKLEFEFAGFAGDQSFGVILNFTVEISIGWLIRGWLMKSTRSFKSMTGRMMQLSRYFKHRSVARVLTLLDRVEESFGAEE